jgi:hypothetical protein
MCDFGIQKVEMALSIIGDIQNKGPVIAPILDPTTCQKVVEVIPNDFFGPVDTFLNQSAGATRMIVDKLNNLF